MTGRKQAHPQTNKEVVKNRKPIFARSCRSAQPGTPAAPREVHLPLLPHGPSGVHEHLPRRTRLRRPAGPEENRSVSLQHFLSVRQTYHTPASPNCQLQYLPSSRLYFSSTAGGIWARSVMIAVARALAQPQSH
jgi:hypothetical protein